MYIYINNGKYKKNLQTNNSHSPQTMGQEQSSTPAYTFGSTDGKSIDPGFTRPGMTPGDRSNDRMPTFPLPSITPPMMGVTGRPPYIPTPPQSGTGGGRWF
jgi:hypothetical protein